MTIEYDLLFCRVVNWLEGLLAEPLSPPLLVTFYPHAQRPSLVLSKRGYFRFKRVIPEILALQSHASSSSLVMGQASTERLPTAPARRASQPSNMVTSSRSFKRHGPPPPRYRTPSPPRYAVEPISPITPDDTAIETLGMRWANGINAYNPNRTHQDVQYDRSDDLRKRGHGSRGSMDAFASIALATSSIGLHQDDSFVVKLPFGIVVDDGRGSERPSKRARSEKLPSPEWHRNGAKPGSRPATSYEQSADSRTLEAELLLNFSQEARFSMPWPSYRKSSSSEPQMAPLLNGTHGFVFGSTIIDQGPHNGHQQAEIAIHKIADTLPGKIDIRDGKCADASLSSLETISHNVSPPRLHALGTDETTSSGLGHTHASKSTQYMEREYDSRTPDLRLESAQEAIPEISKQMEGTQRDDLSNHSGTMSVIVETESGYVAYRNACSVDGDPCTEEHGTQPTKGLEVVEGKYGQQRRDSTGSPNALVKMNMTTVGEAEALSPEACTLTHASAHPDPTLGSNMDISEAKDSQATAPAICAACNFTRNSLSVDNDNSSTSWISCDGCKKWFHFACAGFKCEREVRGVDKYRCRKCKPIYGPTTYVRKSSRAHTAIDYAGLHQGVIKTSDETPEHHYIKPIKDGTITFQPENFARMRPELVTAEYFEKGLGMKEPIVIPAHFNSQPGGASPQENNTQSDGNEIPSPSPLNIVSESGDWFSNDLETQRVLDHGQDALGMVIPRHLTVRRVAELYGPDEKVEVIDVKSQNGEGKKWNMRRWADYYESSGNKVVRNVISLEVSQSKLGKLIRRPQIVRDLDLQDSVWPLELQSKGEYPRVQFYCLMSVANCFTDFHIDFGGSSVFYHILKGKKTFLFIPPKEKHLKKYEEWCMSPAQNWTFLADQTKECYRVDLAEGDTMLIPAGWIHAVWTPEDSLVIGGNFLTRLNYGMQLRIAQIEKATGVARKFRYPHFQKIHWYTALRYLEDDPLPDSVRDILQEGGTFHREQPTYYDFNAWGENSRSGRENYHSRYYSQAELEGLADLTGYLLRIALIDLGSITEGITTETRNAVKKAIPRGYGEPIDIAKRFAMWSAWKRGESIPIWAYAHTIPEGIAPETAAKLSIAAAKKASLEATLQGPRRKSARRSSQQNASTMEDAHTPSGEASTSKDVPQPETDTRSGPSTRTTPVSEPKTPCKKPDLYSSTNDQGEVGVLSTSKKRKPAPRAGTNSRRKPACESCRKRRRACKHRDPVNFSVLNAQVGELKDGHVVGVSKPQSSARPETSLVNKTFPHSLVDELRSFADGEHPTANTGTDPSLLPSVKTIGVHSRLAEMTSPDIPPKVNNTSPRVVDGAIMNASQSRGRSKACNDCRKSKVRSVLYNLTT